MELSKKGIIYSLLSSLIFAALPAYFLCLSPLSSPQVLALRILWTFIVMFIVLLINKQFFLFFKALKTVFTNYTLTLTTLICASIMGIHQALFVWGPTHGILQDIAMGYFLSPLILIALGRLFYKEYMRPLQMIAVLLAICGVGHQLLTTYALSWVTMTIATTYPIYVILRKHLEMNPIVSYLLESTMLLPIAIVIIFYFNPMAQIIAHPKLWLLAPGLGVLTAGGFLLLIYTSKLLPLNLVGILSYIEPALVFLFSVVILHEPLQKNELWTYIPILIAIIFVIIDSVFILRKQMKMTRLKNKSFET